MSSVNRILAPAATPNLTSVPIGEFAQASLKLILDNHLPGETSQSRIKQIGMLSIMHYLQHLGLDVTAETLVKRSGVARGSLDQVMKPLIDRGLVREELRPNKIRRGKELVYHFDKALFDAINAHRLAADRIKTP